MSEETDTISSFAAAPLPVCKLTFYDLNKEYYNRLYNCFKKIQLFTNLRKWYKIFLLLVILFFLQFQINQLNEKTNDFFDFKFQTVTKDQHELELQCQVNELQEKNKEFGLIVQVTRKQHDELQQQVKKLQDLIVTRKQHDKFQEQVKELQDQIKNQQDFSYFPIILSKECYRMSFRQGDISYMEGRKKIECNIPTTIKFKKFCNDLPFTSIFHLIEYHDYDTKKVYVCQSLLNKHYETCHSNMWIHLNESLKKNLNLH